jgi:hypothetical protein
MAESGASRQRSGEREEQRHRAPEACAAAGDQNAFTFEQIWLKHFRFPPLLRHFFIEVQPICHRPIYL